MQPFWRRWATPRRRDLSQVKNYEFALRIAKRDNNKNERHAYQPRYNVCVTTTLFRFIWHIAVIYTSRWLYAPQPQRWKYTEWKITFDNASFSRHDASIIGDDEEIPEM